MITILKDPTSDCAEYLGEMLSMWGLAAWEIGEPGHVATDDRAIVVPTGVILDAEAARNWLDAGRHLVLLTPHRNTLSALGIDYGLHYGDDGGLSWLRMTEPLLHTFSHHSLPILGKRLVSTGTHYANRDFEVTPPPDARVHAYMSERGMAVSDRAAIWSLPSGRGLITVFNYDLVECMRNLRQGRPRYTDWKPAFDDICRGPHLFGPEWPGQFGGAHLPLADLHPLLLVRVIENASPLPLPRLWQLPGGAPAAILVSGDEDSGDPQYNEEICSFLDGIDAHMTIYILVLGGQSTPEQLRGWMGRGHSFSVHPYPMREASDPAMAPPGDVLGMIEACVSDFKARYNLPVRSIRNHRAYWTGYTAVPELWAKLGVEMDANYCGSFSFRGFESGFAVPASSLPLNFLDTHFRMIPVLQQPVAGGDDSEFTPPGKPSKSKHITPAMFEAFGEALLRDALLPLGLPWAFIFHPCNFVRFAGEQERRFLHKAKDMGAALISDIEWLDFWQARRSWRMVAMSAQGSDIAYRFAGTTGDQKLSVTWPLEHKGRTLRKITEGRRDMPLRRISHAGQSRAMVSLPEDANEAEITVSYT